MKIYILDRNAVSCIKDQLNGKIKDIERVRKLKSLDKRKNFITPLFSIREGQIGKRENQEQMILTLKKESDAIAKFYKHARTDSKFLLDNIDYTTDVFANNTELQMNSYISIVEMAYELLVNKIPKSKRFTIAEELINHAKSKNISLAHPIVMCCLSVLYGSDNSRKILKPKKLDGILKEKSIHNAISDIMTISRVNFVISRFRETNKNPIIRFITFDKHLSAFLDQIKVKEIKSIQLGEITNTKQTVEYNKELFPDIDQEEFDRLSTLLKA